MLPDLYFTINFSVGLIASIIAVIICILTIFIVIIDQQCHNVTNLLACNTCIAVIFYCIIAIVTSIYGFREDWAFNAPLCAFRGYCFTAGVGVLCYSYSIQAISRLFFAVFYKHKQLQTYRTHWIMIIINWFFAFIVTIVPFFIENSYGLEKESRGCVISSKVFAGAFTAGVTVSLIPLNIVTIIYGIILHRVRQSGKRATTIARSVIKNVLGKNIPTPNMKRQAKIMHQMSINSSILTAGGFPMFFLIIWHEIKQQPAPEPLYVLGFNSITICVSLMTIAQFIMNDKVKSAAVNYIHPRQPSNILNTTSQRAYTIK
jgi:hypothetical protein